MNKTYRISGTKEQPNSFNIYEVDTGLLVNIFIERDRAISWVLENGDLECVVIPENTNKVCQNLVS